MKKFNLERVLLLKVEMDEEVAGILGIEQSCVIDMTCILLVLGGRGQTVGEDKAGGGGWVVSGDTCRTKVHQSANEVRP